MPAPIVDINQIDLPPDELRTYVATLIATGLSKTRPPCVVVEKIKMEDLHGAANFIIGGLMGLSAAKARKN